MRTPKSVKEYLEIDNDGIVRLSLIQSEPTKAYHHNSFCKRGQFSSLPIVFNPYSLLPHLIL